jgi:hypothetical protein
VDDERAVLLAEQERVAQTAGAEGGGGDAGVLVERRPPQAVGADGQVEGVVRLQHGGVRGIDQKVGEC